MALSVLRIIGTETAEGTTPCSGCGERHGGKSLGTGFVIAAEGGGVLGVTNSHLVRDKDRRLSPTKARPVTRAGVPVPEASPVTVVCEDVEADIAVVLLRPSQAWDVRPARLAPAFAPAGEPLMAFGFVRDDASLRRLPFTSRGLNSGSGWMAEPTAEGTSGSQVRDRRSLVVGMISHGVVSNDPRVPGKSIAVPADRIAALLAKSSELQSQEFPILARFGPARNAESKQELKQEGSVEDAKAPVVDRLPRLPLGGARLRG